MLLSKELTRIINTEELKNLEESRQRRRKKSRRRGITDKNRTNRKDQC